VDFALLDGRGRLLANPWHYRDARTDGVPERVHAVVPAERVYAATGIQSMQINTLYQIWSMVESGDPLLDEADKLLMTPDLFHHWLSGSTVSDRTIASTSAMLTPDGTWAEDLLRELGIPTRILPQVVDPATTLGGMRPELARRFGFDGHVPIVASGSHDTASAVAAISGLEDAAYLSSGTWSLMGAELDAPVVEDRARRARFTNEHGAGDTFRLQKNLAGLWPLQELRRRWRQRGDDRSWERLLAEAEAAAPLRSLIDLQDERFVAPVDMEAALRGFCRDTGQPEPHTVGELVRCCLESLALSYRRTLRELRDLTSKAFTNVRIVGGGSRNELLNRFAADACELPVFAGPVEATGLGNVMLQAVAEGYLADIEMGREVVAQSVEVRRCEPSGPGAWPAAAERLEELVRRDGSRRDT